MTLLFLCLLFVPSVAICEVTYQDAVADIGEGEGYGKDFYEFGKKIATEEYMGETLIARTGFIPDGEAIRYCAVEDVQNASKIEPVTSRKRCEIFHYKNNMRNGRALVYSEDGTLRAITNWKDDKLNGGATYYFDPENASRADVVLTKNYSMGEVIGNVKLVSKSGDALRDEKYEKGGLVLRREFYPGGGVYKETEYNGSPELPLRVRRYYKNGNLMWEQVFLRYYPQSNKVKTAASEVVQTEDGKDGVARVVDDDGELIMEVTLKNGKRNGLTRRWASNQLREEEHYVDDKLDGIAKSFYSAGRPYGPVSYERNYKAGVLTGGATYYYYNGKILQQENYINGELVGAPIKYSESGEILSR